MTTPTSPEAVDVRGISSSDISTALTTLASDFVALRAAGNADAVEKALRALNTVADLARRIHA